MKPRNLLIAAVLLAALSGVVWWAKKHPQASPTSTSSTTSPKLAEIPDAQIQSIDLKKRDGAHVNLQRQGGKWVITAPESYPADQDAVSGIVSSLSPVTA